MQNALKAQEAKRLDEFSTTAAPNPERVMETILHSANPSQTSARFKRLISGNKVALEEFKTAISTKIAAESLRMVDKQVAGAGRQEVIQPDSFSVVLDRLGPLTKQFLSKAEMANLERIHNYSSVIMRDLQTSVAKGTPPFTASTLALEVLAKLGALRAVSAVTGSQSIVLSGVVSKNFKQSIL